MYIVYESQMLKSCIDNSECDPDSYCAKPIGDCEGEGTCMPRPSVCPSVWEPVCGCDGQTYANECEAAQAGVRVSALGSCDCDDNEDCDSSDYCAALVCDGPGLCESRSATPCDPESPVEGCCNPDRPVTGCDGVIYPSECDAISAGVRVRPDS